MDPLSHRPAGITSAATPSATHYSAGYGGNAECLRRDEHRAWRNLIPPIPQLTAGKRHK